MIWLFGDLLDNVGIHVLAMLGNRWKMLGNGWRHCLFGKCSFAFCMHVCIAFLFWQMLENDYSENMCMLQANKNALGKSRYVRELAFKLLWKIQKSKNRAIPASFFLPIIFVFLIFPNTPLTPLNFFLLLLFFFFLIL